MAVSGRAPYGTGDGSVPYFFLSYARHHRFGEDKTDQAEDPDRWTLRFFDDLAFEVTELTTMARGAQPGFMDREVRVGEQWRRRISEALAVSRVFLPLYTPRYFTSLSCASEWYLFQARQSAHELISGTRPEAIIPVLWLPIPDTELPAAARALQFDHHTLGDAYARLGFLQLIRLARYKDDYQMAIHALARHVVRVAHHRSPRPAFPVDFTTLHGRFQTADGLFAAAGERVRRAGAGRAPQLLRRPRPLPAGAEQLALPPGTGVPGSRTGKAVEPAAGVRPDTESPDTESPVSESPVSESQSGPAATSSTSSTWSTSSAVEQEGDTSSSDEEPCAPAPHTNADAAVAAYVSTVRAKLAEWFTGRPAQVSSVDFDEFYFRSVHPAAKTALLRRLTPQTPPGPFPRPPRLRGDAADPPPGGPPHVP